MKYINLAVYRFVRLEDLHGLRQKFKDLCAELELKGTILLAHEGLNCFIAGSRESVDRFKGFLEGELGLRDLRYKESVSEFPPFHRMLIKLKKEIITMGVPEIQPEVSTAPRLQPEELKRWLDEGREVVLLDTRNDYEVKVGTFKGAIDFGIASFRQFVAKVDELPQDWKSKPIVTFCTGGIRCEKAAALMEDRGFKDVYQLDDGILGYFERCGDSHYDGECFVFDWRQSVNGRLEPRRKSDQDPIEGHGRHLIEAES